MVSLGRNRWWQLATWEQIRKRCKSANLPVAQQTWLRLNLPWHPRDLKERWRTQAYIWNYMICIHYYTLICKIVHTHVYIYIYIHTHMLRVLQPVFAFSRENAAHHRGRDTHISCTAHTHIYIYIHKHTTHLGSPQWKWKTTNRSKPNGNLAFHCFHALLPSGGCQHSSTFFDWQGWPWNRHYDSFVMLCHALSIFKSEEHGALALLCSAYVCRSRTAWRWMLKLLAMQRMAYRSVSEPWGLEKDDCAECASCFWLWHSLTLTVSEPRWFV